MILATTTDNKPLDTFHEANVRSCRVDSFGILFCVLAMENIGEKTRQATRFKTVGETIAQESSRPRVGARGGKLQTQSEGSSLS